MPYIRLSHRIAIAGGNRPKAVGELNYVITKEILRWLHEEGTSYATLNSVIGVLECAKLELYRRIVAEYEDEKKLQNGDVYKNENSLSSGPDSGV